MNLAGLSAVLNGNICSAPMTQIPVRQLSDSHQPPNSDGGFSIRAIDELLAGSSQAAGLHRHDFYSFLAVERGSGDFQIDLDHYTIADHMVFAIRPGQVIKVSLGAETKGYMVHFNTDFVDPASAHILRRACQQNVYRLDEDKCKQMAPHLRHIHQEYRTPQEGHISVMQASLVIYLVGLIRLQTGHIKERNSTPYQQERLDALLDLLETQVTSQKQVSEYAEALGLSTYQLNAITKTLLGKTCSELITEHLILEAKRYLLSTPNQVKEIAYKIGYEDVSYFIRFFKKHTGQSPEAFRQNFT